MISIRPSMRATPQRQGDMALRHHLEQHPLLQRLSGTVAINPRGVSPWHVTDARPRVVVITTTMLLAPSSRAYVSAADGIVLSTQAASASPEVPDRVPAIAATSPERTFLAGTTTAETAAAWREVARHPALAQALCVAQPPDEAAVIADLVVELIVALGN